MIGPVRWGVVGAVVFLASAWGTTAVPRVRSVNLNETQLSLLSTILSSSYEKFSGAQVSAQIEGATEVIEAVAFGLGDTGGLPILVRVQRRSDLGVVLAQAELRLETMDDAPLVCDRLAEALVKKVPLESTQTRHNIVEAETRSQTRLGTEKILGVKLGFGAPLAMGTTFNAVATVQFDGRFEKATYFFELGAGFVVPGPSTAANNEGYGGILAELGASKYLNDGNTGFYVGGGVMPRLIFSNGATDSPLNLAPYAQFGVMIDRASSTRLYADVRVAQNVLPVRIASVDPGVLRSTFPTEMTAAVGIGW